MLGLLGRVTVGDEQAILQAAILCRGRQPLIDTLHELACVSCEKASTFSRPGGGRQAGAAGSNGGKVLGMVMPGGPPCAADGADMAIKPGARTAMPSQMTCRRIAVLPGNIVVPHGLAPSRPTEFCYQDFWIRRQ